MEIEMEMEMEIGSGLGLAGLGWSGLGWTGLTDCLNRSGLDWTGLDPCGWTGTWWPGGLEKPEQHSLARKRTTDSSHRIKMDTC